MKKTLSILLALILAVGCMSIFCACADGSEGNDAVKVVDVRLTDEEYAFAVQKGDTELLASLNEFMAEISSNGTFDEIIDKYFGDGTPTAVTSASTMKTDGSQLIVATNAAFEPFEYMKGDNYYGVDMEIMALFAEHIGRELYINNMEFDAVCLSVSAAGGSYEDENGNEVAVSGGVCDVAAAGLTVSDTRREILDFTDSYYNASQMLIVKADDTTFDGCKTAADVEAILNKFDSTVNVGVQNGTTGQKYCQGDADWEFDGFAFSTKGYSSGALAVQDIINGGCDFVIIDEGPAKAISTRVNEAN